MKSSSLVLKGLVPSLAALPQMQAPSKGGSGIMQILQNHGSDIAVLVGLLLIASMFIGVCYHAYAKFAEIHTGRATWGQFGLTVAVGRHGSSGELRSNTPVEMIRFS